MDASVMAACSFPGSRVRSWAAVAAGLSPRGSQFLEQPGSGPGHVSKLSNDDDKSFSFFSSVVTCFLL